MLRIVGTTPKAAINPVTSINVSNTLGLRFRHTQNNLKAIAQVRREATETTPRHVNMNEYSVTKEMVQGKNSQRGKPKDESAQSSDKRTFIKVKKESTRNPFALYQKQLKLQHQPIIHRTEEADRRKNYVPPTAEQRTDYLRQTIYKDVQSVEWKGHKVTVALVNKQLWEVARMKDPSRMSEMLRNIYRHGLKPDAETFSVFILFYSKRDARKMEKFYNVMKKEKIQPQLYTWSALISGYAYFGNTQKIMETYREMIDSGETPTTSVLNIMMAYFSRQPHRNDVSAWFKGMIDSGIKPDTHTFNTLIRYGTVVESADKLDAGELWLQTMEKYQVAPTTSTFNILIDLYSASPESVRFWVKEMEKRGLEKDDRTWLALLKHACKHRDTQTMKEIFPHISTHTFANNLFIAYYIAQRDIKTATKWLDQMIDQKIPRNTGTYNMMLRWCVDHKDWESLREWTNRMTDDSIEFNNETNSLLGLSDVSAYNVLPARKEDDNVKLDPFNFLTE